MKKLLTMIALAISLSSFSANALEAVGGTLIYYAAGGAVLSTIGTFTMGDLQKAEANSIVADAQEYTQSGELSVFLKQKIKDVQAANEALSEEEALDALISVSLSILK